MRLKQKILLILILIGIIPNGLALVHPTVPARIFVKEENKLPTTFYVTRSKYSQKERVKQNSGMDLPPVFEPAPQEPFWASEKIPVIQDNLMATSPSSRQGKVQNRNPFETSTSDKNKIFSSVKENYSNKPHNLISLHCSAIQVRVALQRLAELTGINIVISEKVKGKITLHLSDLPWKQVLDVILQTQSLAKQEQGNIIYIAPIEEIVENNKQKQAWQSDSSDIQSKLFQIKYAKASDLAGLFQGKESGLLSSQAKFVVDGRTNTLWIQDNIKQLQAIKKVIQQLDVPTQQVLIEARIVNVTKEFAKDLGLRFGVSRSNLSGTLQGANQWNSASSDAPSLADRLNLDLAATPIGAAPASIGLALAKLGEGILLDLELSALESEGRGEVISSPRLIAINQQAAIIEAGEEIPYQEAVAAGVTAVVFKKAVLSLKVTPRITSDCRLLMDLKINQDIPSPKVFNGIPTILTKEIQTSALVNDGQTIVLGGIYKHDKIKTINRVPFLGELPVVGTLFRKQSTSTRNEELLIFITPRIIKQMG